MRVVDRMRACLMHSKHALPEYVQNDHRLHWCLARCRADCQFACAISSRAACASSQAKYATVHLYVGASQLVMVLLS